LKLEDIPKKPIFNIPDGYFDQLPGKIQARISAGKKVEPSFILQYKLQYIIPVIFVFAVGIFWFVKPAPGNDAESILASVETEYLVAYLNESELTTEDVLEEIDFSSNDIQDIEMEVYQLQLEDEVFDDILDQIDVENM
jgi:hypothetical protein